METRMYSSFCWQVKILKISNFQNYGNNSQIKNVTKLFCCRFTVSSDKEWFDEAFSNLIQDELGPSYHEMAKMDPVYVDFMR